MLYQEPVVHQLPTAPPADGLDARVRRSELAWRQLGQRVRSVTPRQLARGALVAGILATLVWVAAGAWAQLLPFQLGLVLAYITLPVVNAMDRVMPRWMAASLMVVIEIAATLAFIGLLVPPIVQELGALIIALPDLSEIQARFAEVRARVNQLPPSTQETIRNGLDPILQNLKSNLLGLVQAALASVVPGVLALFNTIGFLLGFFGIPTWLVAVLTDQRAGTRTVNRMLPRAVRSDFWAVLTIADRVFTAFVRGQVVLAIAVGVLTWVGLTLLDRLGPEPINYEIVLAMIAGVLQLIPAVGPIISTVMAVALGLTMSPRAALAIFALYVAVQVLTGKLVAPHVEGRYIDVHPAVLVIVLVLLSQFGFLWVLIAAPLTVVLRDLIRYVYGRLSEPPRPAGVLYG